MTRLPFALLSAALLAACGSEPDQAVGGVSATEAAALNDAAAMLDNDALAAPGNAEEVAPE